jgi:hypothetical protein
MKNFIPFLLVVSCIYQANAQSSNCSPTLSEIYDFEIGDKFLYGIRENPGGGTQDYWYSQEHITILDKTVSGDTTIYYRGIYYQGGNLKDTLILINDSTNALYQCDSSIVKINSFLYYHNYRPDTLDFYSYLRIYNNDTVRTWGNDHPKIVKGISGNTDNNEIFTKSDSGTFELYDFNLNPASFRVEFTIGSGLLYEEHFQFESHYEKRLIYKTNGTDTTVYHTASINKAQLSPLHFSLFPNPVKNTVNLEFNTSEERIIAITSSLGKIIKTGKSEGSSHSIDLSTLTKGTYFLNSTSKNKSGTLRFIKE